MYKRLTLYPNGAPIPASLPDSYQPAVYGNAPAGQSCFTCKNFNLAARYCVAWKATVKPRWWCEGWSAIVKPTQSKINATLLKKITTNTVEEHFTDLPNSVMSEDSNESEGNTIKLNVPLIIRLLEFAREDAKQDVDLHTVVENLIELSADGETLEMEDYDEIVQDVKNS